MTSLHVDLPDQYKQPLAPWRQSLASALNRDRSKPHSRYLQLATIDTSGRPSNRTLVFRGFIEATNVLTMVTDRRSAKLASLTLEQTENHHSDERFGSAPCQLASIAWYLTESREQFCFSGEMYAITEDNANRNMQKVRACLWENMSDDGKQSFFGPPPGQLLSERQSADLNNDLTQIPTDFVALMFNATECDHLALRPTPHQRHKYWLEGEQWQHENINP